MAHPEGTLFELIRHGEPEGGPRYRGALDDPLSDQGWYQMTRALGDYEHWDAVITSPLLRCRDFAVALAGERGLPLYEEPDLREMGFGDWEGRTADEIRCATPGVLEAFWSNPLKHTPPGGETLSAFHQRVTGAWRRWSTELESQRILVVCHGGVIRMLVAEVMGTPLERAMGALMVPYASRTRIRLDRVGDQWMSCLMAHGVSSP
mgnify:CR=1 FL=1